MKYLAVLFLMTLIFHCAGPQGDQGPTGDPGDPGTLGTPGQTGAQGSRGDEGEEGEPADDGLNSDCQDAPVPIIGQVEIENQTTVDGTLRIHFPVTYSGTRSLSFQIQGSGDRFIEVSQGTAYSFIFDPMQSGIFLNSVVVSDGCQLVTQEFEIVVDPGWRYSGFKNLAPGSAYYPSLAADDNGTPYVAFVSNGSSFPNEWQVIVLKQVNGTEWEDLGNPGKTRVEEFVDPVLPTILSMQLVIRNGTLYVAYIDSEMDNKITVKRLAGAGGGTEMNGGGSGTWEPAGSAGFSQNGVEWISFQVENEIPYLASCRNGSDNNYKIAVHYLNGVNWQELSGPVTFSDFYPFNGTYPSLSVDNGTPYLAYTRYDEDAGIYYIMTTQYNAGQWELLNADENQFDSESPSVSSLFVYQGTPYLSYVFNAGFTQSLRIFAKKGGTWKALHKDSSGTSKAYLPAAGASVITVHQGIPYIAYMNYEYFVPSSVGKFQFIRYDPSEKLWFQATDLADAAIFSDTLYFIGMAPRIINGIPYLAYTGETPDLAYMANLIKYPLGGRWEPVPYK